LRVKRWAAPASILAFLLLSAGSGGAQVPASLFDDPFDLRMLYVLSGRVLPSGNSPYSGAAARSMLEDLQGSLTDKNSEAVADAISRLDDSDVPMVDIRFTTRYEHYFRPSEPLSYLEWSAKVDPLGILTMSYQTDLSLALFIEATIQREYYLPNLPDNGFSSLPGNPVAIENNFVRLGYLMYSSHPLEIVFGRQEFSLGPSPLTSLIVSREVPFLDALDVNLSLGRLHMTLLLSTLENRQTVNDLAPVGPYDFTKTVILHNIHYFEYDFGFIRAGIGGQVVINRPENAFQIADFFPVFSWHNASIVPNNLTLTVDVSAVPLPGLEVYAQYGFDDINATVFGGNDASIPTIDAGLIGVAWRDRWPQSSLEAILEAGFTHYLWGSFEDDVPLARAINRVYLDGMGQWMPLNSPFGPGVTWVLARASVATPWNLDINASVNFLARNPLASLVGPYEADVVVASASRELSLQAGIEVVFTPWKWLRVTLEPEIYVTAHRTWMELTIGAGTALEARRSIKE
jgi:hypothetical protein